MTTTIPIDSLRHQLKARHTPQGRHTRRQIDPQARADIAALLKEDAPLRRDRLIEYLHRIQDHTHHLSAAHLAALAEALKLSQAEVFEVASFYHHFDLIREGEAAPASLTVRVCATLSCQMAGAAELLQKLPAILGQAVRIIEAPCIGRCAEAPAICIGQNAFGHATPEKIQEAIQAGHITAPALPNAVDYAAYQANGGYQTYLAVIRGKQSAEAVLSALEQAGLRGLGGAGFPAGRKWRIVREQAAPRLMAVNIDEGEPGTFKDRHYLEHDPHRFLEGMLIAAHVVGIEACYLYLRDEYHACRALLMQELAALQAAPPGGYPLPAIELRRGAGAYICGEESAMIESIEGKRGLPRQRPPYLAQVGLFGRPTLEHNLETLHWVRDILEQGAAWFTSQGRHGRQGLRSFSLSGRINRPGVHLAPAGITVRELIDEYGGGMLAGHTFYAYLPGGASGGILPASLGDIPLDFDTLQPHGGFIGSAAVIILSQHDRARDAALNVMRFFADESCGQCTPCRVGTEKMQALLAESRWRTDLLQDLSQTMIDASICGLGQAAPNPVLSVIRYFPHEI